MTDGLVGNDFEIIDAVKQNAGTTRVFTFGIGNSVNRFLLDGIACAGRGEVRVRAADRPAGRGGEEVLRADRRAGPDRHRHRLGRPAGRPTTSTRPRCPDLWSVKPLVIKGRLKGDAEGPEGARSP